MKNPKLYSFLVSLNMTQPEAAMLNMTLDARPETKHLTSVTFDEIAEALNFVREKVPEHFRAGPLFGAN